MLDGIEDLLEGAEGMVIDFVIDVAFDYMDANDNGEIEVSEVEDMVEEFELDEEEEQDVFDAYAALDTNDDEVVDADEFYDGLMSVLEENEDLYYEMLDGATDLINEFDVDCSADGVEGCEDEWNEMEEAMLADAEESE